MGAGTLWMQIVLVSGVSGKHGAFITIVKTKVV